MKKVLKAVICITIAIVWVVSMFFFVPYDLKTVEMPDDKPNQLFDKVYNFNIDFYFSKQFDDAESVLGELVDASYRCLSADETYDILMNKSNNNVDAWTIDVRADYISYSYGFDDGYVSDVTFFTLDSKNYVLFTSVEYGVQKLRFIGHSYNFLSKNIYKITYHKRNPRYKRTN